MKNEKDSIEKAFFTKGKKETKKCFGKDYFFKEKIKLCQVNHTGLYIAPILHKAIRKNKGV